MGITFITPILYCLKSEFLWKSFDMLKQKIRGRHTTKTRSKQDVLLKTLKVVYIDGYKIE